jgi:putative spermidine/putrescine transport system ATP-binding protein
VSRIAPVTNRPDAEAAASDSLTSARGSSDQVVFEGISKSYGGTRAVRDLDLDIRQGEFFTLLGPSGSGKTTILRMLAGLESVTAGRLLIDGRDVSRDVPEKRNVGLVFQNYALFPHMNVTQNIAFPLKMRHESKSDIVRKVDAVLEITGLRDLANRFPNQMSGGQQQRVAVARAFVFDPSILLMDEPLGALDRNLRDHMRVELKLLQKRIGATVLYVTHDQDEALAMSDRIGIMHSGLLQQVASPEEMYERPINSFVAKFLGESVCLPALRKAGASRTQLKVDGLSAPVHVTAENDVCDGEEGAVMVRPEKLRLDTSEPGGDAVNKLSGTVETIVYLGSKVQVLVRGDAGAKVQIASDPITAHRLTGERVWASWPVEDTRFLPVVD